MHPFLIYGANGYTGKLVAEAAVEKGYKPLLAGRSEAAVKAIAHRLQLPYQIVDLNNCKQLDQLLQQVPFVIHAAGPFKHTAQQMVEACIRTRRHYIDVNGDIAVFEFIRGYHDAALAANIMLLPGAGFDVVPSDCAAMLAARLCPGATHLRVAFCSEGNAGLSHGTATTMLTKLGEGCIVREAGALKHKPLGHKSQWLQFMHGKRFVMTLGWGDVSTAYVSTGISNIETYTGIKPSTHRWLKMQGIFNWVLRMGMIRNYIQRRIDALPAGPDAEQRSNSNTYFNVQATAPGGKTATVLLKGPNGYTITADACILLAVKFLAQNFKPGYQTPATAYGEDLVMELPGIERQVL